MHSVSPTSSNATRPTNIALWIAIAVLAVICILLAVLFLQASQNLELKNSEIAALRFEIAKEASHAAELKSDLLSARADVKTISSGTAQLKSQLEIREQDLVDEKAKVESAAAALTQEKARLPPVPVRIQMRPSLVGRGLVAVLTNTSARHLSLIVDARNPTTETNKQLSLQVAPGRKIEVGFQEGFQFASGDRLSMRSDGYEDIVFAVP